MTQRYEIERIIFTVLDGRIHGRKIAGKQKLAAEILDAIYDSGYEVVR
ncbi:MAG: hypothetical protein ACYC9S_13865 [Leptospirales bacterium]